MGDFVSIHSGQIWGEESPFIPEKIYDLSFVDYSTKLMIGKNPKLVLRFNVMEFGDYFEILLPKYYGVKRLVGKPGKYGGFEVGRKSNFLRDYLTLFPSQPVKRTDRISMSRFKDIIVRGKVKTVTHGFNQRKIPEPLQYSVIEQLIGVKKL